MFHAPHGARLATEHAGQESIPKLNVLLVSADDDDRARLTRALEGTRWQVLHARSCEEAERLLADHVVPVIIRDEDCCVMGCPHAVHCTQTGMYPAALIVAAPAPDCRMWVDVIDCGGLEVLAKPFDPARVRKVVEFAWDHWRRGDLRRHWDRFDYPE